MKSLELKIPPPVVVLVLALAMWGVSATGPRFAISTSARVTAASLLAAIGVTIILGGALTLRKAKTTINPMKPETASALVTGGVYRITRNPMYVGLLFVLTAWAAYLSSAWALLGPPLFILYITRFQIVPEERALQEKFGSQYSTYKAKARRWL